MDAHYFTAYSYKKLLDGLPNAKLIDSERLVNWARLVKSDTEIAYMKDGAKLVNAVSNSTVPKISLVIGNLKKN